MQAIEENTGFLFAHGERILKADTKYERVYENGALTERRVTVLGYTVYPFPQVVLDGAVFTKHYFAGTMRFATQVSPEPADRFLSSASRPLSKRQRKDALHYARKAGLNLVWAKTTTKKPKARPNAQRPAAQVYFYHPDHLGTATLLTDIYGKPYQLFLNLPFGEEMAPQHAGGAYATRYKFNGKELDPQTGYYYYGARYYDPVVSRWLSVDPLAERFAGLSPYNYVFNNPLIFIDPTGKGGEKATDEWIRFSTGEVVRVGDKGGDEKDYIHKVDIDGNITIEVVDVKKSYVSISGTEIPRLIDKSPGFRKYDATPPAIKQVCVFDVLYDLAIEYISKYTGINSTYLEFASMFLNPRKGISTAANLLKRLKTGSKGYKLAEKLLNFGNGRRLPTPSLDKEQFRRVEDFWIHIETGSIYKKSHTSHGNPGNIGTQWKIYPKNTTEFGKQAKEAAYRVTIDYNGNVVGH